MTDEATEQAPVDIPKPIVYGVASALSPMVRRIVARNPGIMTGPGPTRTSWASTRSQ